MQIEDTKEQKLVTSEKDALLVERDYWKRRALEEEKEGLQFLNSLRKDLLSKAEDYFKNASELTAKGNVMREAAEKVSRLFLLKREKGEKDTKKFYFWYEAPGLPGGYIDVEAPDEGTAARWAKRILAVDHDVLPSNIELEGILRIPQEGI